MTSFYIVLPIINLLIIEIVLFYYQALSTIHVYIIVIYIVGEKRRRPICMHEKTGKLLVSIRSGRTASRSYYLVDLIDLKI